ncbi:hypothetical protein BCR34DRAFT_558944 [Clohesyomyces aquaticus]|uniref:Zn(2)-C6 fungal-type domain-containing protein n=1 Tax=Clohesyomyces aquaticus TaxID=1231657 RepID=A0A1Y1ZYX8_9PLEO|nr:hypothetical protein BCR34DRAFT_558944 [Clohesyomyces aquaticus]
MNSSRRNGKPASCEPCRKNKTRCDHAFPKCDRCHQRGIADQCFYHPAPLTKPKDGRNANSSTNPQRTKRRRVNDQSSSSGDPAINPKIFADPSLSQDEHFGDSVAAQTYRPGYLGPTSYAAILPKETASPLRASRQASIDSDDSNHELDHQHPLTKVMRIQMVTAVLKSLRNYDMIRHLLLYYCESNQAGVVPASLLANAVNALQSTVDKYDLTKSSPDPQLISAVLENSSQPLNISPSIQASGFHQLMTGENLRLEILGTLFAIAARSLSFGLGEASWNDNSRRNFKPQFTDEMLRASTSCLFLCNMLSPANDVVVWLFYENLLLSTTLCGYTSPPSWRRVGELATQIYALGMHKESKGSHLPHFILETRRRIFCSAFNVDKTISTFLGRPPRLSRRHTDIRLPLDISDEDLVSDPTTLEAAIGNLDSQGWNTQDRWLRSSWIRQRYRTSQLREEILDISFSLSKESLSSETEVQLLSISVRNREVWAQIPAHMRYYPNCWDDSLPSSVCLMMVIVYLTYLLNEFLVQKLLDSRMPLTSNTPLLRVSMDLVSTALTLGTIRDRTYDVHRDFLHTIVLYGIPSGSVLVSALQEQQNTSAAFAGEISRSEMIRMISVLISHLENVAKPGDGNYRLCRKATKAFKRVVDAVLDPKPAQAATPLADEQTLDAQDVNGESAIDLDFWQAPGFDGFDGMELLGNTMYDGVDWGTGGQWTF